MKKLYNTIMELLCLKIVDLTNKIDTFNNYPSLETLIKENAILIEENEKLIKQLHDIIGGNDENSL